MTPFFRIGMASAAVAMAFVTAGCQPTTPAAKPDTVVMVQPVAFVDYAPALTLTGSVRAQVETPLSFRISGQVTTVAADIGDRVSAGQVLATISPQEQQADVDAAQAALDATEARLAQAQSTFDRQNSLLAQGLVTHSGFETAQTALQTAEGSRDAAQAQLATAKEALTYTELTASAAGIITQRNIEVDEVAQAGATVFVLAEGDARDAVFNVQETAFVGRKADIPVQLQLVSNAEVTAAGRIREVAPTIDPQTGTVEVKIDIEQAPEAMALGAPVIGTVPSAPQKRVVLPSSALWMQSGGPAVWSVDADNAVAIVPVSVTAYGTDTVVIDEGLIEGQIVVTQGGKLLTPGQIVTPTQGAKP